MSVYCLLGGRIFNLFCDRYFIADSSNVGAAIRDAAFFDVIIDSELIVAVACD